ncbi:hypothetical protein FIV11_13250 [Lactiplantibacillus plantarum]|uniref:hypothetical protein n=1 Tax=Lactiplantibacillus plantarum TaxID=1590 RepID=UPI00264ED0A5|nr:hypothetical protein [Lactiplantibacillus plantarum]MDN7062685.1 hypothetical protein [Lactiplantibacillus plantarum]
MARLSILGARRVEALQVILEQQKNAEINKLIKPDHLSEHDAAIKHGAKVGVDIVSVVKNIEDSLKLLKQNGFYVDYSARHVMKYGVENYCQNEFTSEIPALTRYNNKVNKIKKHYADLKNRLWLCETLEEAKEIVGMTDEKEGN